MTTPEHEERPGRATEATSKRNSRHPEDTSGGVDAASDFTIKVSEANTKKATYWPTRDLLWSEHVDSVLHPRNRKECGGYLLGDTGKSGRRTNENVRSRSGANIDVDYPSDDFDERAEALFKKLGCAGTVHPTFSSTEEEPRRRVTIPFNRDATPEEWLQISRWIGPMLEGEHAKGEIDEASYVLSQMMWKPATPDLSTYEPQVYPGQPLDVDAALLEAPELPPPAATRQDYTGDGTPYEDLTDGQKQAADESVDRRVGAWRQIIQRGLLLGEKEQDEQGRGWERMSYKSAWSLALLGYAPWSPIDLDDAREIYDELIPWEFTRTKACRDKWDSAVAKVVRQQKIVPAPWDEAAADFDVIDGFDDLGHDSDITEVAAVEGLRFTPGGSFILDVPDRPVAWWGSGDFVLGADGETTIIAGGSGTGKTTLGQQLSLGLIGVAGYGELLGYPVIPTQGRVLYLAMDRPSQIARSMRRMVTEDDRSLLNERLVVWPGPPPRDLAQNTDLLTELAREAGATHVIVDSLKDAALKLNEDEGGAAWNRARQTALQNGINLTELHHNRKGDKNGAEKPTVDSIYGSTWITAGAGSVILLGGAPGDPIIPLFHVKQPMFEVGPFRVTHDQTTGSTSIQDGADLSDLLGRVGGLSAEEAAGALFDTEKPTKNEKEKARRKLDLMVKGGSAVVVQEGDRGQKLPTRWGPVVEDFSGGLL